MCSPPPPRWKTFCSSDCNYCGTSSVLLYFLSLTLFALIPPGVNTLFSPGYPNHDSYHYPWPKQQKQQQKQKQQRNVHQFSRKLLLVR